MSATLKDVSLKANVSVATVSRVLNNARGSIRISKETSDRVLSVARELGYRPNRMAQAMRTQRTNNIGVVFCRDLVGAITADLFYMQVLSRVEELILDRGYNIILSSITQAQIAQRQLPQVLAQNMVDAMIVLRVADETYLQLLQRANPATLLLDYTSETVDCVASDNRHGMQMAVDHLVELGHRNIGYIDSLYSNVDPSFRDRLSGYRSQMTAHGLCGHDKWIVAADPVGAGGCEAMSRLFDTAPELSAVICANDNLAIHALKCCQQRGVEVPSGMSLIGFDDVATSAHLTPPLTTLAVRKTVLGEKAVQILLDRLDSPSLVPVSATIPVDLIVRGSTAPVTATA